jgi:hypothetical protein
LRDLDVTGFGSRCQLGRLVLVAHKSSTDQFNVGGGDPGRQEVVLGVETVEGFEQGGPDGRASPREDRLYGWPLVLDAHPGEQCRQRRDGQLVVLDNGLGLDIGQGQQQQRNQSGAVTPGSAVEQDASSRCAGQRTDDGGASLGLLRQKWAVVERCAVEPLAVEVLPELDVFDVVEGNLDAVDAARGDRASRRGLELCAAAELCGAITCEWVGSRRRCAGPRWFGRRLRGPRASPSRARTEGLPP